MDMRQVSVMDEHEIVKAQKQFMSKVYAWMVGGLLITGFTAWYIFASEAWVVIASNTVLFWMLIIGEVALVYILSARIEKMTVVTAAALFLLYSALNGLTLSVVFAAYTIESIQRVFFIAAGMFGALSLYGFTTKRDLTAVGQFMIMGLFGLIIATVVNIFFASSLISFGISVIGVIIFAGLTAYDTQKLKDMFTTQFQGDDIAAKASIIGALTLYLDFFNFFLFLLRLFGDRK